LRRLKRQGFCGSLRVVTEWATSRRRAEKAEAQSLRQIPSARTIARLLTISRITLSKSETITVAAIEDQMPLLVEAREIIAAFHAMIRRKSQPNLDPWLDRACASLVASFANGSSGTRPPWKPRSTCHGPTVKPKAKSRNSSS